MKVCILIGSAEHPFFREGSDILRKHYVGISENIEVWSYMGGSSDELSVSDNTIVVPEDPREYSLCFIRALEWVMRERKPDVICKTNTSLVLNIRNLSDFINHTYRSGTFYGYGLYYTQTTHSFPYIPGFFWLFSKDIARVFVDSFDDAYNKILPLWTSGELIIPGPIPDDIIITDIIGSRGLWRMDIPDKIISIYPFFTYIESDPERVTEQDFRSALAVRTRMPGLDYDERYRLELPLTAILSKYLNSSEK